jgi:hypothetical protein
MIISGYNFFAFDKDKKMHSKSRQQRNDEKNKTLSRNNQRQDLVYRKNESLGSVAIQVAYMEKICKEKNK